MRLFSKVSARLPFGMAYFSLALLASCSESKAPRPLPPQAPRTVVAPAVLPSPSPSARLREEVLRQMEDSGLGIISIHPDAKNTPPNIFSPDAFPKAKPDAGKPDLKQ